MANEIIPDSSPNPESALGYDGADFKTLKVDADGHPQVDVLTSALPTGAATAENQNAQLMELQLIDDLRGALAAVGVDTLLVKGQDQLFSFKGQLLVAVTASAEAGANMLASNPVPSGEIWEVTQVSASNDARGSGRVLIGIRQDEAANYWFLGGSTSGAGIPLSFSGHMYLGVGNRVACYITDCIANDLIRMQINGYKMTKET